jgi:hypothetical protein
MTKVISRPINMNLPDRWRLRWGHRVLRFWGCLIGRAEVGGSEHCWACKTTHRRRAYVSVYARRAGGYALSEVISREADEDSLLGSRNWEWVGVMNGKNLVAHLRGTTPQHDAFDLPFQIEPVYTDLIEKARRDALTIAVSLDPRLAQWMPAPEERKIAE